jgi:hypothetical protein
VGSGGSFSNPADNLIQNGDFTQGDAFWNIHDGGGGDVTYTITSGTLCSVLDYYLPFVVVGWPVDVTSALVLDPASGYELSYDAWSTAPSYALFEAKAGEAVSPFAEHFLSPVSLSTSSVRRSHTFLPASSEPSGIVFLLYFNGSYYDDPLEVCVANVVLRKL